MSQCVHVMHHALFVVQQFVQDKENLGVVGKLATFKYVFGSTLKADQLRVALDTANMVTSSYTSVKSSLQCSYYDAEGNRSEVTCNSTNYNDCARLGEVLSFVPCVKDIFHPTCCGGGGCSSALVYITLHVACFTCLHLPSSTNTYLHVVVDVLDSLKAETAWSDRMFDPWTHLHK
jgi:hypothetical protein